MNAVEILEELRVKAAHDDTIRDAFLATRQEADPLQAFCRLGQKLGYELYPMDLVDAGEEFYASYRRSTNGGGENSPLLEGQDDFYEMFFAALEH